MHSGLIEGVEYAFGTIMLPEKWLFPRNGLVIDPSFVYGDKHLLVSIYSHLKGLPLAKDKNMDLLLRITGKKQIKEALEPKPKKNAVLVVVGKEAEKEYNEIVSFLGAKESGDVTHREGELDAIERTALVGV